ncbi:heat stress transcription factor [Musa troglodytarum]|uniref:Heat stress transcription factor n=1 Tax=Musa troglodytarum TaxID=320322 RepID=A0A9E7G8H3_9LILI|nr:heat stress transcription factor [Musa troglodytarum]
MEGSRGSSNSPPPFLTKTYEMVDDPSTNSIVSWSPSATSFVVWNTSEFARDLLPKYFKHNNFSSFVRQLNTYGFRKADPDQWEFANDDFIRGQRHLLKNIYRRKPVHSHSLHNQGNASEAERQELEEEIERLKQKKGTLLNEFRKQTEQRHGMEHQMQSVEDRLQVLENRQRSLMAFLAQIIQKPGFLSNIVQFSDLRSKKRRLPKIDFLSEDAIMEDNQIMSFQPVARENSDILPMYALDMEPFEKMESSLNSLENFFKSVSQASGDDVCYDSIMPCLPSNVILDEMNVSSGETDANLQLLFPNLHPPSPCPGDIHSSLEVSESTSDAETPVIPATEIQTDSQSKVSEIDMNLAPAAIDIDSSRGRTTGTVAATGANDVFWEQFLTEIPGSSDTKEVQSKRRDLDDKQSQGEMGERGGTWCDRRNVDHLAGKMENLTSAD